MVEFLKEIRNYTKTGITDEELAFTKNSIGQADALKYETAGQKAVFIKRLMDFNLEKNYVEKQNELLKTITKKEINSLAVKHLPFDNMVILVVGDKSKCWDGFTKLGYELIELDMDGNPITGPTLKMVAPTDSKEDEMKKPEPAKKDTPDPKKTPVKVEHRDIKPR